MNYKQIILKYINDVISGREIVGNLALLRVKRHLTDLETCYSRGMYFDEAAAMRAINFFKFLKHSKGSDFAGKPFVLSPWQAFDVWCVYGWRRSGGKRRFRYTYLDIARKNGKTTFAAANGLFLLIMDAEPGAEVYTVATKRDQARIAFDEAKSIVFKSPDLQKYTHAWENSIVCEMLGSTMKALSSDAKTMDGLNPHGIILDEFHAHKDDLVFNVMKSALGSRTQPLFWLLTTAGFNRNSPCFAYRDVAIKILLGLLTQDDLFVSIHTLDDENEYENEEMWVKSNPNLNISVKPEYLRDEYQSAKNNPNQIYNFLTKNMNIWTDSAKMWIPFDKIKESDQGVEDLTGVECYGALDLASVRDTTAFCLLFKLPSGKFTYRLFFWMPEMNVEERVKKKGINYDAWIRSGHVRITQGNVTDYDFIRSDINALRDKYKIKKIAYDRWNSSQLIINLVSDGLTMHPYGQGYASMSAPTKEFERQLMTGNANLEGNPVMEWHLSNVLIIRDPAGNIKIDKDKSSEKVDGPVTAVMALGTWMIDNGNPDTKPDINKTYATQGIRTI